MSVKLRYEFYLPTSYNDGSSIEPKKQRFIKEKIVNKFKAVSVHPATVQGTWIGQDNKIRHRSINNFCFL